MGHASTIETFLNYHRSQLLASAVPEIYWKTLYKKLLTENFDAGKSFQLVRIEYEEKPQPHQPHWAVQALCDLHKNDSEHIYLVDHAWTFQPSVARSFLRKEPLKSRIASMLGIQLDPMNEEQQVDEMFDNIWRLCGTYSVRTANSTELNQVWYVMDEIGSAVLHRDNPNCRIVPFFYLNGGIYSLLFLQESIEEGDLLYRDYAEGITNPLTRRAALLPWEPSSFEDVSVETTIPDEAYFSSGHIPETLPALTGEQFEKKQTYLCYTQYELVAKHLNCERFKITENETEADILWYTKHFRDFTNLGPGKFVNQFPYEYVLTVKDLLCMTCRRYKDNKEKAPWMPVTYNLVNEVGEFVSYFQKRQAEGEDNFWIIKPYNLARGMDMHITNNLNYIMRLPATGPKIAQKYLTNPVLFYRPDCEGKVKFDIRYVILLKSVKPLECYVYKNFFLRFANKPFELKDFDDYEKHFTVMNYTENVVLKHLKCEEFKHQWQQQYADFPWDEVEKKILQMIGDIVQCATKVAPPCGIAESPQSRALYAADLMLDWTSNDLDIQPKILEINYMPDCERACIYYPDFYNDIFRLLFLDENVDTCFKVI